MISQAERLRIGNEGDKKAFDNYDLNLRCASPGIIRSFNPDEQTVTVQLAIRERIKIDGIETDETIPLLVDVPIVLPMAGGFYLSMPIQPGDECLVVFGDTCFDAWHQSGGVQNQMSLRRHDLSDGFAIIGVNSQPNVIPGYQTNATQLRNDAGTNYFRLSETEIEMVFGPSYIKIDSDGITVNTPGFIKSTSTPITVDATDITVTASTIDVTGVTTFQSAVTFIVAVVMQYTLNVWNTVTMQLRDWLTHRHTDTEPGEGNSGGVL